MDRPFIFKALLISIIILILPILIWAKVPMEKEKITISHLLRNSDLFLTDSTQHQQQDKKTDKGEGKPDNKEKATPKEAAGKPDIREVPKARRQSRPPVVVKPNVKVKPIKVIRPNIKRH